MILLKLCLILVYLFFNLANQTVDNLKLLQDYLNAKGLLPIKNPQAYRAYLSGDHLLAQQQVGNQPLARNYNAALVDPAGGALEVKEMQSNFSNTGLFIGTDKGIFILNSTDLTPTLLSRTNSLKVIFIALNNKLLFLNTEHELVDLKFSDERKGYVEDKVGRYQTELYRYVNRLVFNPSENALYGVNGNSITRAITELKSVVGFSRYLFQSFDREGNIPDEVYYTPSKLFIFDGKLHMLTTQTKSRLFVFNREDNAIDYGGYGAWYSRVITNPMIYNNLVGFEGATLLIDPVRVVALFYEGIPNSNTIYRLGSHTALPTNIFIEYRPIDKFEGVDYSKYPEIPVESVENILGYRASLDIIQSGQYNLNGIRGFQALNAYHQPSFVG